MAYIPLINKSLKLAFRRLQDLAVPATFNVKTGASFDFSAKTTEYESDVDAITKIVILSTKKKFFNKDTLVRKILYESANIPSLSF